ncbi:hypothetical protein NLM31_08495 [Bradyrhizobium sp. CCGUVB4N]|uniref:hypothetical protein n=1 Tax=Bradyrhizobium sp. CCGUVB4N TaxID=2949631 RepID=UPI0020B1D5F7|nr:hypothetical protein [Bradyrhizobium sp. CCGUVB4N]MCP3380407.1 hypothetical protein [Bradyrhizobium sp. CCGUVB4N]
MPDFMPLDCQRPEDAGLAHGQFESLKVRIGDRGGETRFHVNFLGRCINPLQL